MSLCPHSPARRPPAPALPRSHPLACRIPLSCLTSITHVHLSPTTSAPPDRRLVESLAPRPARRTAVVQAPAASRRVLRHGMLRFVAASVQADVHAIAPGYGCAVRAPQDAGSAARH